MDKLLIRGGLIISCFNEDFESLRILEGDILVEQGFISKIGANLDYEGTVIDARGKIILPGFVNAHSHSIKAVICRGLTEGHKLWQVPFNENSPIYHVPEIALSVLSREEFDSVVRLAVMELIEGGTTTVLEQCTPPASEAFIRSSVEMGLRAQVALTPQTECRQPEMAVFNEALIKVEEAASVLRKGWGTDKTDTGPWLAVGFRETCNEDTLRALRETTNRTGMRLLVSFTHTEEESEGLSRAIAGNPVRHLSDGALLGPDLVVANCFNMDQEDRFRLLETGTHLVYCPKKVAEGNAIGTFSSFLSAKEDVNVAIGTDDYSSDMFGALKTAALLGIIHGGSTERDRVKATDILYSATVGGAKALGREDVGRIAEGFRADMLVINAMNARFCPSAFPLINAIYHGWSLDIETVIIDGEVVKRDGSIAGVDTCAVVREAEKAVLKSWTHARKLGVL